MGDDLRARVAAAYAAGEDLPAELPRRAPRSAWAAVQAGAWPGWYGDDATRAAWRAEHEARRAATANAWVRDTEAEERVAFAAQFPNAVLTMGDDDAALGRADVEAKPKPPKRR